MNDYRIRRTAVRHFFSEKQPDITSHIAPNQALFVQKILVSRLQIPFGLLLAH